MTPTNHPTGGFPDSESPATYPIEHLVNRLIDRSKTTRYVTLVVGMGVVGMG